MSSEGCSTFYQKVSKLLIRESGKSGVFFLHFLDGECVVFAQQAKLKPAGASDQ